MNNYQTVVDDFAKLLHKYFANTSIVKNAMCKPSICIVLPYESKGKDIEAIIRAHDKTKDIPEFDDELLENNKSNKELIAMSIIDGTIVFGQHVREDDGTDSYLQKSCYFQKKHKIVDMEDFKPIHFYSTEAVDSFCKIRNKLKAKEDRDIFTALVIHSKQIWYKPMRPKLMFRCIQITQDMIDTGLTQFYCINTADLYIQKDLEPYHIPIKAGDYIFERAFDGQISYGLWTKQDFESERLIVE